MEKSKTKKELEIENFNLKHPPGSRVRYWTGKRDGVARFGNTRTEAQMMCNTPVVWITGAGAVALSHVDPVRDSPKS